MVGDPVHYTSGFLSVSVFLFYKSRARERDDALIQDADARTVSLESKLQERTKSLAELRAKRDALRSRLEAAKNVGGSGEGSEEELGLGSSSSDRVSGGATTDDRPHHFHQHQEQQQQQQSRSGGGNLEQRLRSARHQEEVLRQASEAQAQVTGEAQRALREEEEATKGLMAALKVWLNWWVDWLVGCFVSAFLVCGYSI